MVESVDKARYVLLISSILVMFLNLFDSINQGVPFSHYIFYVLSLLVLCIVLMFIHKNFVVAIVLALMGLLTMIDTATPNYLSGGIVFFIFSMNIFKSNIFSFFIYFLTMLIVIGSHVFNAISPADAINVLIAYAVIYLLNHFLADQ